MSDDAIGRAESRVAEARARLTDTVGVLQQRVQARVLARNALEGLRDKAAALADDAVSTARERPVASAGVAATVAVLALHRPIARLFRRILFRNSETEAPDDPL